MRFLRTLNKKEKQLTADLFLQRNTKKLNTCELLFTRQKNSFLFTVGLNLNVNDIVV